MHELNDDTARDVVLARSETVRGRVRSDYRGSLKVVNVDIQPGEMFAYSGGGQRHLLRAKAVRVVESCITREVEFEAV